jgi:molybdenum-dependent DNA-binding transcriptional regulator ModE
MNDNFETLPKTPITEEQFNNICNLIEINISVNKACKQIGISKKSFYEYLVIIGKQAENRYAHAKEQQTETMVEELQDLEEECIQKLETIEDPKKANATVQAYKLKMDNVKWIASKLKAKKYGDKLDLTTNGNDITREIVITPIANTTKTTTQSQSTQDQ